MLTNVREVTGYLFSRERDHSLGPWGDHLGIGGTSEHEGRVIFHNARRRSSFVTKEHNKSSSSTKDFQQDRFRESVES